MSQTKLEAKVAAVNKANAYAMHLYGILAEILTPLVGTKILKTDGYLTKAVEKLFPVLPNTRELMVYKLSSSGINTLAFGVKTCEPVQNGESYVHHETTVYIGNLDGQTLIEIGTPFIARPNYTAQEIIERRDAYKKLQEAADDARYALRPFGVSD